MQEKNKRVEIEKTASDERILSFYGLATRAGKTLSGMDAVEIAIYAGEAYLLLIADDASDRTKEKAGFLSGSHQIPCFVFSTRELLGKFSGKADRAVCAVMDEGFAKKLYQLLKENKQALQIDKKFIGTQNHQDKKSFDLRSI